MRAGNARLRWGQRAGLVLIGAAGALSHAPFDIAPFVFVPLIAAFWTLARAMRWQDAFWNGWAIGIGYFGATVTWITEPFQVDAAVTGWMAPFALVLLALLLGVFWAIAMAASYRSHMRPVALLVALTAAEMARAYVFTGFPWASPPQALVGVLGGQGLAWGGPHGMMFVMALAAAIMALSPVLWVRGATALATLSACLLPVFSEPAPLTPHVVRLIQPNAPQHEKWDREKIPVFIDRQIDFTASSAVPDLVLMPETALPYLVETAGPVFDVLADAARGAPIVLGIQRRQDDAYFNSLVHLDAAAQVTQTYDKHHLVPFGEYMPAEWLFRRITVGGLAQRAQGGYSAGAGPALMDLGALGKALPLICYEVVFAQNLRGVPERPDFLMNLTNDAWFGTRSGPQQHLAQARMRAIEQGLPMLRAANTGISAVIDPQGRILDYLALNTAGYLDVALPEPGAATLYSRIGDLPFALFLLVAAIALWIAKQRTVRRGPLT